MTTFALTGHAPQTEDEPEQQFCEQVLGMVIVIALGLILGWNPHLTPAHAIELGALLVLGMLAFTWMGVFFGMLVRSSDAMQGLGFIVIFPLTFLAGTFVAAVRQLTEGYHATGSWQLLHPEIAMLLWCLLIIAVCVPLALRRFNRKLAS